MQNVVSSASVTRQDLWLLPRSKKIQNLTCLLASSGASLRSRRKRRHANAPIRPLQQLPYLNGATASEIVAEVLNEGHNRPNAANLLELLDREGWGVTTEVTRKFSTKFASVTLEASWDDELPGGGDGGGGGRVQSRRLAVLAVLQEWLVARSSLVGRLMDSLERLRPGYLPREIAERVRSSRAASPLTPESEALDGPSLLLLAALVLPPDLLTRHLDGVLAATRAELLASPAYLGRADLVPSLDRGLLLLRSSAVRTMQMAKFRATHIREALALEAELRRQRRARQSGREETTGGGLLGMWFRETKSVGGGAAAAPGQEVSARAANDRLYAGQLAAEAPPWMTPEERREAAAARAGRSGPRGLPGGRAGRVSFRPLPGAALYSDPGRPGSSSFGGSEREAFSALDAAMGELLSRADHEVPAAALSAFARLHRTSLLDLLSSWQWAQLAGAETDAAAAAAGAVRGFYQPRCSHAASLRPAGPLQVGRRTRIDVAPGPELEALRALARRRGSEVLAVVHPLAKKQVVSQGEWEYWREAYRLWERYAPMPTSCRTASLTLVLTSEQVPYVGLLEAEAAGRAAAASGAVPSSAAATAAALAAAAADADLSSLTSMSSLDFDDAPLPAGLNSPGTAATAAAATAAAANSGAGGAAGAGSSGGGDAAKGACGSAKPAVQTETTVQIFVPPPELRRFLLAFLELLPSHVGEAAAAAAGSSTAATGSAAAGPAAAAAPAASSPAAAAAAAGNSRGSSAAGAAALGEWLPADATAVQIRYCPLAGGTGAQAAAVAGGVAAAGTAAASSSPSFPSSTSAQLPEELQLSCYELRWALGSAALTTEPTGPSAAASYSRINIPAAAGRRGPAAALTAATAGTAAAAAGTSTGAVRWCAPLRLTQAQLLSLVNIFTDVAQRVPELYGIKPQRLVVPTRSPLERLVSALQGAAGSAVRALGLLALLAVPLAAAVKAGGGDLDAMVAAAGLGSGGSRFARGLAAAAAAATARHVPQLPRRAEAAAPPPRAQPSAEAVGAAAAAAAAAATPPPPAVSAADLAALCRQLESDLAGRMWLEVSGTAAAGTVTGGVLPSWVEAATAPPPDGAPPSGHPEPSGPGGVRVAWPEFQLVVAGGTGEVLGCRPVNAAARAVLAELPLAAALRGPGAERAVAAHLAGLTRERIEQGRATPGRFDMSYQAARFRRVPAGAATAAVLSSDTLGDVAAAAAPEQTSAPPQGSQQRNDLDKQQIQEQQETAQRAEPRDHHGGQHQVEHQARQEDGSPQQQPLRQAAAQSTSASASSSASPTGQPGSEVAGPAQPGAEAAELLPSLTTTGSNSSGVSGVSGERARGHDSLSSPSSSSSTPPSAAAAVAVPTPTAAASAAAAAASGAASAAAAVVLKLELRPSLDPADHVVQGKAGKTQREYARAEVGVRPWYDSDSLLCWLEGGVQLPSLVSEVGSGLLAREERDREAFLTAYEQLVGGGGGGGRSAASVQDERSDTAAGSGLASGDDVIARVPAHQTHGPAAASSSSGVASRDGDGAAAGRAPVVLKPQELSAQQLQEALQQLMISLGVPEGNVRVGQSGGGDGGIGGGAGGPR